MANKTVSNLKEVTTVSNSDVLLVETSTETLKVTKGNLLKEVNEELNAKSDANHTHDEYVTESELNSKGLATEMFVTNKIAEAQLGNDGGNMDLSGYATTEYVDQEVGKTNAQLSTIKEHCTGGNGMQDHSHVNKVVLDKISEFGGEMFFNGKKIGSEIESLLETGNNRFNGTLIEDGVIQPNGNITANDAFGITDFISVKPNEILYFNKLGANGTFFCCYGADSEVIKTGLTTITSPLTVPANVYSMRFACSKEDSDVAFLSPINKYEPYVESLKIPDKSITKNKLADDALDDKVDTILVDGQNKKAVNGVIDLGYLGSGNFIRKSKNNKFNGATIKGEFVSTDGTTLNNPVWCRTEKIELTEGETLFISDGFNTYYFCFYDKNNEVVVTGIENLNKKYFIVPSGVSFGVFCSSDSNFNTNNNEYISTVNYYEPYEEYNQLNNVKILEQDIIKNEMVDYIPILQKVVCIGDSTTAGVIDTLSGGSSITKPESGYPAMLSKIASVQTINYGQAGKTTQQYVEVMDSLLQNDNASAVIIMLGINDIFKNSTKFDGTVADLDGSVDSYPSTSVGSLCKIIDCARRKNPNAIIFLSTLAQYYENTHWVRESVIIANNLIKEIANKLNCYVIDLYNESGMTYETGRNIYFGTDLIHFTELGYFKIAHTFKNEINKIINNNLSDFLYPNVKTEIS